MAEQQTRWAIKKEIAVGDLIAFVMAFVSIIYAWSTLDRRIAVIERDYMATLKNAQRIDEDMAQLKRDLRDDLQRINDKLDRLMYVKRGGA